MYTEINPSPALAPYIQCFYTLDHDGAAIRDFAFSTGCIEIMFTLEGMPWNSGQDARGQIQLWGQVIAPLPFNMNAGRVFGIRFRPTGAGILFEENVSTFNDKVLDLSGVLGNSVTGLHDRLQYAASLQNQVALTEKFLLRQLEQRSEAINKIDLVTRVASQLTKPGFFDNIENIAGEFGITSRYLQNLFIRFTGMSPKLLMNVNRFQHSLVLMGKGDSSLLSVALDAGYYDQPHFIREFKKFTGSSPSGFSERLSSAVLASPNK